MMRFPLTLVHMLERMGRIFPETEVASRRPDRSIARCRYGDVYRRARALAAALTGAGLQRGDRVATLMWNHAVHLECYFGVPTAGGVLHTLNLRLDPRDIAYIANHARDRFLIVDAALLPLLDEFRDDAPFERVFVVGDGGDQPAGSDEDYERFVAGAPDGFDYPEIGENEAAGICYSSGTTGRPKGVAYSHRTLALHSLGACMPDSLGFSMRDVVCPVVPMFHVNAWGIPFAAALAGAKQVFPGPHLDGESLLDLFAEEQVTMSAGVPTLWFNLVEAWRRHPGRWRLHPDLRVHVGGAPCPVSLMRDFDDMGIHLIHAWGMTETTPIGSVCMIKPSLDDLPEDRRYALRTRAGLPVAFVEARVIGDDGEAPWDDETMGELQVRGPWIAASYIDQPDSGDRWTEDGWFRTGDVATIDAAGYIKICDRTKDLVKSGGEWISSVDLENAIMGHAAVKEAAVIAVAHPKWQERPLAAVVLEDGETLTAEALRAYLAPRFVRWWLPDAVVFVDAIPRTSTGKFKKAALRERFADWRWDEPTEPGA